MSTSPLAGQLLPLDLLVDLPKLIDAYLQQQTRPWSCRTASHLRHIRPPWLLLQQQLQRKPCPGDHPGNLRLPGATGY